MEGTEEANAGDGKHTFGACTEPGDAPAVDGGQVPMTRPTTPKNTSRHPQLFAMA